MEGGYQIIDLKYIPIDDTATVEIPGVFNRVRSTKKPLLLQNVVGVVHGVPRRYRDFFCTPSNKGTYFIICDYVQLFKLTIYDDDTVSFEVGSPLTANMIPINNTLEVDANGDLGVKANS